MQSYRVCHRRALLLRVGLSAALIVGGFAARNPPLAVVGIAHFVLAELSVRRQLKPYLGGPRNVTITMTDEEYRTDGADRATSRSWTTFTNVRRVGGFWVLRVSNGAAMAFPIDALDAVQTTSFEALMRTRGLLAAE